MGIGGILALGSVALALWYWFSSLRARERASAAAAETCRRQSLQFLDDTVALQRLALRRTPGGALAWQRTYGFEYSETGTARSQGFVLVLGAVVQSVGLAPPGRETRAPDRGAP